MPSCFVASCTSGYASNPEKVPLFTAPTNAEYFAGWKKALPKRNVEFSATAKVCAKHFREEEIRTHWTSGEGDNQIRVKYAKVKLLPGAIPSIFASELPILESGASRAQSRSKLSSSRRKKPLQQTSDIKSEFSFDEKKLSESSDELPCIVESTASHTTSEGDGTLMSVKKDEFSFDEEKFAESSDFVELPYTVESATLCTLLPGDESLSVKQESKMIMTKACHVWDLFDSLMLTLRPLYEPHEVSICTIGDVKCLAQITLSSHRTPRLTAIKELRTTRNSNAVQRLVMGEKYGDPKVILSSDELIDYAVEFFSVKFCSGVPGEFNEITAMKNGCRNILNRWQDKTCSEERLNLNVAGGLCSHCCRLERALISRTSRLHNQINSSNQRKNDAEKVEFLRRKLNTVSKAKHRLMKANAKLKEIIKMNQEAH